jgi:pyridoxal phosphate enzyme (YggS family)
MSMDVPSVDSDPANSDLRQPAEGPPPRSEGASPAATDGARTLRDRHAAVLARIGAAARDCGRDPGDVALLAVSKTFDADAVLALAACGQRDFGESYLQEALPKMAACRDRWAIAASGRSVAGPGGTAGIATARPAHATAARHDGAAALAWHFIGPIQSNKTRAIAESFDWVHSVERDRIARRLSEQRPADRAPLQVCVQVDVSGEATKSGCAPEEAVALGALVASLPRLVLRGVMAIPAPSADPALQRAQFARVRAVFDAMRSAGLPVDTLSIGMSGDLEAAIAEGATIVRVGTALFGARPGPGLRPSS